MKWIFLPKTRGHFYRRNTEAWVSKTDRLPKRRRRLHDQKDELIRLTFGIIMLWFCVQLGENIASVFSGFTNLSTSPFVTYINVPPASSGTPFPPPYHQLIFIYVSPDNKIESYFGGVDPAAFSTHIQEIPRRYRDTPKVVLIVDKNAQMHSVHKVLDAVRNADLYEVIFAVDNIY